MAHSPKSPQTTLPHTVPTHSILAPGATIGVLGGGQLGRMLAQAGARLGYRFVIFEPQAHCPACHVADHIEGHYEDRDALDRFAAAVDVVTLEFENVPMAAVEHLSKTVPVRPGAKALSIAQDRATEKRFINAAGIGTAPWAAVGSAADLDAALADLGRPSILKTARLGYDGKGQAMLRPGDDTPAAVLFEHLGAVPCVLEGFVDFALEISVLVARGLHGDTVCFEPAENIHRNHILHRSVIPARLDPSTAKAAEQAAIQLAEAMDYIGVLAVEMFVTQSGQVLVNELAPRPHNSGHWSIDGAATSQFEQTVRAICGLPLGDTTRIGRCEMTNLIGDEVEDWESLLGQPGLRLHLYGKTESRPGRKMGHYTLIWPET